MFATQDPQNWGVIALCTIIIVVVVWWLTNVEANLAERRARKEASDDSGKIKFLKISVTCKKCKQKFIYEFVCQRLCEVEYFLKSSRGWRKKRGKWVCPACVSFAKLENMDLSKKDDAVAEIGGA